MKNRIAELLEEYVLKYNHLSFIADDPISIPHLFTKKEDIEIAGFLAAILAWGQRKTIIQKSKELMQWMDYEPYQFINQASEKDLKRFDHFKHRTFNGTDCITLMSCLKNIYEHHGGLEQVFTNGFKHGGAYEGIEQMAVMLFGYPHLKRTEKHLARPSKGSAAKRINMFLRWMVRKDKMGVDFGIWNDISPEDLICPLDLHSGTTARRLGLLERNQNDWTAAVTLTETLKQYDPTDPVKYDFALFGLGVNKQPFPYF